MEKFQQLYCHDPTGTNCVKPASLLRLFDGSYAVYSDKFDNADFNDIPGTLQEAQLRPKTSRLVIYVLGAGSTVNAQEAKASIMRSFMHAGFPLEGYNSTLEKPLVQRDVLRSFHRETFIPFLEGLAETGLKGGEVLFFFYSESILDVYVIDRTLKDLPLLLSSMIFIFILVYVRVGSLFIGFFGLLATVNCFFFSHILYVVLVQARYLAVYHLLSVFILLGLGSYNLFIIYDMWIETETLPIKGFHALPYRYGDTMRQGGRTMMSLTFTTGLCFFMQMFSPFRIIGLFGLFAFLLMFVNFFMVMIFMPVTFLVHENRFARNKLDCCVPRTPDDLERARRKGPVELFLSTKFFACLTGRTSRFVIVIGFTLFSLGICGLFALVSVVFEEVSYSG